MKKSKEKYSKEKIRKSIIISIIIGLSIATILFSCLIYAYKYIKNTCKDILKDKSTQELLNGDIINNMQISSYVYDKDGNQIGYLYGNENRVEISYNDLPKNLINAIVSIEDERFFEHSGVDIKRTSAAILNYLSNKKDSNFGGSSITQQLVKNLTEDDETSITRKVREWYRAFLLETKYSKEDIIKIYTNTIYLGENSYGVQVASKVYFDKPVNKLNLAECAILAAAIQSPEATNPYTSENSKQRLLNRQKVVLNKMLELGKITQDEYNDAISTQISFKKSSDINQTQSYFVDAAIEDVAKNISSKQNISFEQAKKDIYTKGYKIYSTLDPNVQQVIDNAYSNTSIFYTNDDSSFMQSAMVVLNHKNGNVIGLIGGAGKKSGNFVLNRATQSYRQPGSCMKPLGAYGPAFELGKLTPDSYVEDLPLTINGWSPKNYYNYFNGYVTVRQAIAKSMNLPAVRTVQSIDLNFAYNFAKELGLKSLLPADKAIAPLSLGGLTKGVKTIEMANAYATIANNGIYNEPKFYTRVVDKDGNLILEADYSTKKVMNENTSNMLKSCLQDVVNYGTAHGYVSLGDKFVAGKTGNTNGDVDQWFCGFSDDYTIACWNGYDDPKAINRPYPYASVSLFNTVMNGITH